MTKVDTSNWKEFKIGDLFEKIAVKKIEGKVSDFPKEPIDDYVIPLLTAGTRNQGLTCYAKREQCFTILKNVISIASNGNAGATYYQDREFSVLQDAYALKLRDKDIPNKEVGLFLASSLNKILKDNFDWSNKAGWAKIKELTIKLPVIETEEIDYGYMERYISELEKERISELEKERISELENYLKVTGINDYALTDEDERVLSEVRTFGEFALGSLFKAATGDVDLQQKDINGRGCYFINSGVDNNGIKGKTDKAAKIFSANTITIDFWGNAYYRDFEYKLATHNHVFSLSGEVIKNEQVGLYIISQLAHLPQLFSYNNMATWTKLKELHILLPLKPNTTDEIDYDYMERYIRAMEKLVIADVVKYKDRVIEETKKIVN